MTKEQEDQYYRSQALDKLTPRLKDDSLYLNLIEIRAIDILKIGRNKNWKSELDIIIQEEKTKESFLKEKL